jgi:excinuclease ABC subunit B
MAKLLEELQRPALIMTHNKTLAAQLFNEFREFFPENAVEYFVSYYDYYQPEAYVPETGTFIEKDAKINEDIDRLRHRATRALFERRDTVLVASVSCIYGLGSPDAYRGLAVEMELGLELDRDEFLTRLVEIQYSRNDIGFPRGTFRVRGDMVELRPIGSENGLRFSFFGDEVEEIAEFDLLTNRRLQTFQKIIVYPAQHYVVPEGLRDRALLEIELEMEDRVHHFKSQEKFIEAQRIRERTSYDLEMIRELGYCSGIENYSRPLSGREAGTPPDTLLSYLQPDTVIFMDESHVTLPQVRGMYLGDRSRKTTLLEHGFRLPSALDNRPLTHLEFDALPFSRVFVSATPGDKELELSQGDVAELIVRPTGLVDPEIVIKPLSNQVDDLVGELNKRTGMGDRSLVTTLTKKGSEDLTEYLRELGHRVRYLHSDISTLERTEILRELRLGAFDVLIGINLLREGLDLPEVSLVAVLDADKEGFLRSARSLIQTCGRASRNVRGKVILYADRETEAIRITVSEANRRRAIQLEYNHKHGITPQPLVKAIPASISFEEEGDVLTREPAELEQIPVLVQLLRDEMNQAAAALRFERAAKLRDRILELEGRVARASSRGPV